MFAHVLEYLRTNKLRVDDDEVVEEMRFYALQIPPLSFDSTPGTFWIQVTPVKNQHAALLGWQSTPRRIPGVHEHHFGTDDLLLDVRHGPNNHALERRYLTSVAEIVNLLQGYGYTAHRFDPVEMYRGPNGEVLQSPLSGAALWMFKPMSIPPALSIASHLDPSLD